MEMLFFHSCKHRYSITVINSVYCLCLKKMFLHTYWSFLMGGAFL